MKRLYIIGATGLIFLVIFINAAKTETVDRLDSQTLVTLPITNLLTAALPIAIVPGRSETLAAPYAALPIKIPPQQILTGLVVLPGGLVRAKLNPDWHKPDIKIYFGTIPLKISDDGEFIFAIPRDAVSSPDDLTEKPVADNDSDKIVDRRYPNQPPQTVAPSLVSDYNLVLSLSSLNGHTVRKSVKLVVIPRAWDVQRIDNLPRHLTNDVTPETAAKIKENSAEIRQARQSESDEIGYRQHFIWPVTGRISGIYGSQRILSGVPHAFHSGIDIAAPVGEELCAPADGVVSLAHNAMVLTGQTLMLDHGFGLSSVFAHLSKILVKPGQKIRQGQPIAKIGMSGRVTGPHVHWGIYWRDIAVDPALLLPPLPHQASVSSSQEIKENSPLIQFSCPSKDLVEK